jgi:hypothetical protein
MTRRLAAAAVLVAALATPADREGLVRYKRG